MFVKHLILIVTNCAFFNEVLSEIAVALTKSTYPVWSLILSPWKLLKFSCITGDLQQP